MIVIALAVGTGVKLLFFGPRSAPTSEYVTTFQPGEFRTVPDACKVVSQATLRTYLPGHAVTVNPQLIGTMQSACTYTLDAKPVFRVLEISLQAYAPSALAGGNGSATNDAITAYDTALHSMRHPGKGDPAAQLSAASGLGSSAFVALQVYHEGRNSTDLVTVTARDRNALITVTMQGPRRGGGLRPVPVATLRAGALAAGQEAVGRLG